jgi:hypothetical protein
MDKRAFGSDDKGFYFVLKLLVNGALSTKFIRFKLRYKFDGGATYTPFIDSESRQGIYGSYNYDYIVAAFMDITDISGTDLTFNVIEKTADGVEVSQGTFTFKYQTTAHVWQTCSAWEQAYYRCETRQSPPPASPPLPPPF